MRTFRVLIGLLAWVSAGSGLWWCVDQRLIAEGSIRSHLAPELWNYVTGELRTAELRMEEPAEIAVGDPIFIVTGPNSIHQVGEIRSVTDLQRDMPARRAWAGEAEALFYPSAPPFGADAELTYYETSDSMTWVLQTMLPPEKRMQIARELSRAVEEHHVEILSALRPVVEESLRQAVLVVEQDLAKAIRRHRPELENLGSKYQQELVDEEVVPLVKNEIWPIIRRLAEPTANKIGRKTWQRVSLWRFSWRYAYDVSPLPEKNRFQKEWKRFVNQEVLPELENHSDELVRIVQEILIDTARNEKVRTAVRQSLAQIIDDPELHRIVWKLIREVVIDNPRLKEVIDTHWKGPQAQRAFLIAANRMEPTVHRIGELLFGTREGGITPEFARVLRNRILGKDRRWFVLEVPTQPPSQMGTVPASATFGTEVVFTPQQTKQTAILARQTADRWKKPILRVSRGTSR